jgi:rhodanese-related sulfurtransferase
VPDVKASYAGDISPTEAWGALAQTPDAVLVDVRTRAEWTYVGVPALDPLGKAPILIEWQSYPTMEVAADFVPRLEAELQRRGAGPQTPIYFLCRSGARSRAAAIAMAAAGHAMSFNIEGGFEGARDSDNHRGTIEGWKAAGLPWMQS